MLFTSDSLLVSKNMAEYHRRIAEAGGSVAVAARQLLDEVDGRGDGGNNTDERDVEKRGPRVGEHTDGKL